MALNGRTSNGYVSQSTELEGAFAARGCDLSALVKELGITGVAPVVPDIGKLMGSKLATKGDKEALVKAKDALQKRGRWSVDDLTSEKVIKAAGLVVAFSRYAAIRKNSGPEGRSFLCCVGISPLVKATNGLSFELYDGLVEPLLSEAGYDVGRGRFGSVVWCDWGKKAPGTSDGPTDKSTTPTPPAGSLDDLDW